MKESLVKKSLAVGVIVLFLGLAFAPSINANINNDEIDEKVESKTKDITPYLCDLFLFGKVSNVRRGGYTPAYWFHIDKVITYGNQDPKMQWIEDCEGHMLSMDFRGFIFRGSIIIGKVSSLYIYDA